MKKSKMILVLSLAMLFIFINLIVVMYIYYENNKINSEFRTYITQFRGMIQRITKLHLAEKDCTLLINNADNIVDIMSKSNNFPILKNMELRKDYESLIKSWNIYKKEMNNNFHKKLSKDEIINESELLWEKSNKVVNYVIEDSAQKSAFFIFMFGTVLINIIFTFLIMLIARKYISDKIEYNSIHDSLTDTYNRNFFNGFIEVTIKNAQRYKKTFSIMEFDIDDFKHINDEHGHDTGDKVLKDIADTVKKTLRKSDTFIRAGGDEFVVFLEETNLENALNVAQKLKNNIFMIEYGNHKNITISIGITEYNETDTVKTIYKRVDEALYKAKKSGKNQISSIKN